MVKNIINGLLGRLGYRIQKIEPPPEVAEKSAVIEKGKSLIKRFSPNFVVLNGPFKGMKYPSIDITELTLTPKICGSYEKQLNQVMRNVSGRNYDHILDIGCAEGYYAVGLAMLSPASKIHCFDINQSDLDFCREMAELNGVSNLTYNNFCSPETLISFDYGKRSFLICDCEGYEVELFTPEVVKSLHNTDVLVELHDVFNPSISAKIIGNFQRSHDVSILNNSNLSFLEINGLDELSPAEQAFAVYEHRGGINRNIFMEWALFTPKPYQT